MSYRQQSPVCWNHIWQCFCGRRCLLSSNLQFVTGDGVGSRWQPSKVCLALCWECSDQRWPHVSRRCGSVQRCSQLRCLLLGRCGPLGPEAQLLRCMRVSGYRVTSQRYASGVLLQHFAGTTALTTDPSCKRMRTDRKDAQNMRTRAAWMPSKQSSVASLLMASKNSWGLMFSIPEPRAIFSWTLMSSWGHCVRCMGSHGCLHSNCVLATCTALRTRGLQVVAGACSRSSDPNEAGQRSPGSPRGFCSHNGAARSGAQNEWVTYRCCSPSHLGHLSSIRQQQKGSTYWKARSEARSLPARRCGRRAPARPQRQSAH
jgi:hypothetical protein